jgi:Virulence factor BrkB
MRIRHYAHLLITKFRGNESIGTYPQNSILSRTPFLLGFGIAGGWLLSRLFPKRRQSLISLRTEEGKRRSQRIGSAAATTHSKSGRGIFSLGMELLAAVGISLAQRYAKTWSSSLLSQIKNARDARALRRAVLATELSPSPEQQGRPEMRPDEPAERRSNRKSVVGLLRTTASQWMEDKCPQLGAALAYFTVFSIAPLVVMLLAVFGLIFRGSEHARDKITEQLQYFV